LVAAKVQLGHHPLLLMAKGGAQDFQ